MFEVMSTTVLMKIEIFRDVTLCRWLESFRCFDRLSAYIIIEIFRDVTLRRWMESSRCFERLGAYIFRIKQSKKLWKGLHLCVRVQ